MPCSVSAAGSTGSKGAPQQQVVQSTRADSLADSESCSEASSSLAPSSLAGGGGSTAGDAQTGTAGSGSSRLVVVSGGEPEVVAALQELSLRAWRVLQQDQQQLEERERERLEQERARREVRGACGHGIRQWVGGDCHCKVAVLIASTVHLACG